MFEDITMEKNVNRSSQSPKGIVDIKKNQDGSFPKTSRKREKPSTKTGQPTKPSSSTQKIRQYGRKTISRSYHTGSGGTVSELAAVDIDFDLKKSTKQNLAHLLNFQCTPRESASNGTSRSAPKGILPCNSIRSLMCTQKHKYNKEQFLQANCQFVVRDDTDYSVYMADPDILVEWNRIEQIRISSFEPVTCPICLDVPSAGKITRCGHVYCWSCILHYLALTDQSWQKCPICFEAVHRTDLKSVHLINQHCFNIGQEITFQLMKREHGSTISIPVSETSRSPNTLLLVSENVHTTVYSKLLLADYRSVLKIIENEENELMRELKENEGCPELCFVQQAMNLIVDRKSDLLEKRKSLLVDKIDHENNKANGNSGHSSQLKMEILESELASASCSKDFENNDCIEGGASQIGKLAQKCSECKVILKNRNESLSSSGDELCTNIAAEDLEFTVSSNPVSKSYFFYQAMDGQQIFLHSLNVRMLEKEYGSLEKSPTIVMGKIIEIEVGSMTEKLRRRLRYLQHLPCTCQFQVMEIDLRELISWETHLLFKDQLEKRFRIRQKKEKEEKKMEKSAVILERKQYGFHSPPRRLRLDSLHHFPQCGRDEPPSYSPKNRSPISSGASSPVSSKRSVSPSTSLNALSLNNTFAEKLKDARIGGGWQKRAPIVSESEAGCSHSCNSISDAVEAALLKARLEKKEEQTTGKNKKKKKPKTIPLCSMRLTYGNP